jgi:hypothetical protein
VRNVLTPSAFCLEDEGLDNQKSLFLINPANRQLSDALQYKSDISEVLIILTGRVCLWLDGIAGSNPTWGHGSLSVVSVVCCQVGVRASG